MNKTSAVYTLPQDRQLTTVQYSLTYRLQLMSLARVVLRIPPPCVQLLFAATQSVMVAEDQYHQDHYYHGFQDRLHPVQLADMLARVQRRCYLNRLQKVLAMHCMLFSLSSDFLRQLKCQVILAMVNGQQVISPSHHRAPDHNLTTHFAVPFSARYLFFNECNDHAMMNWIHCLTSIARLYSIFYQVFKN